MCQKLLTAVNGVEIGRAPRILYIVKLTQRTVILIAVTIVVALAGLVVVQLVLLSSARRLKEQAFRDNAINAMQTVARQLEVREAAEKVRHLADSHRGRSVRVMAVAINDSTSRINADSIAIESTTPTKMPVWMDSDKLHYTVPAREHVVIEIRDSATGKSTRVVDTVAAPGAYSLPISGAGGPGKSIFAKIGDSPSGTFAWQINCADSSSALRTMPDSSRMLIVSQVVDNLILGESTPLIERLDSAVVKSLLTSTFEAAGIDLPFAFGVVSRQGDSVLFGSAENRAPLGASDLRTRLFSSDLFAAPAELSVVFPDRAAFVTRQLLPLTIAVTSFMVVIALCFVYTIVTIMRQRRFAQRTVDFINNMTHEFKTPLSTVALACDALVRPDVATQSEQVQKYQKMIRDENSRMRANVDKILQMAVLEEGDYELTMTEVDLHTLVATTSRGPVMLAEQRGGRIVFNFEATNATVTGDAMHLTNIVANLLDNAVKYSVDPPEVTVTTATRGRALVLTVTDKGIGISGRDIGHVFEKYYRVRTGNVHNVKGFGIGLSYVKLMTEAMGGTVSINSQSGMGTTVVLTFPMAGVQ